LDKWEGVWEDDNCKLGSEEEKKEVMRKKNRIKGDQIFIENDLTWRERKTQERIIPEYLGKREKK